MLPFSRIDRENFVIFAIRLAICAAAIALPVAPAFAADTPPASSTPLPPGKSGSTPTTTPTSIPEPAAIGLFALGIAGAAIMRRQRRKPD
ncbi:PEP-CTERM sorting domain-containing protein [Sphingomonas sp. LT1P40]|uniref:PEP-CTERM sorting domain-containing protein n=1 Tax=Alteristakelama amylovorans TaxID=3096166 RepID=UPI002FC78BEB